MRPLDKGSCPQVAGGDKTVTEYGQWRSDLISRIGYYCAYCNVPMNHQLQVEHAVAKVAVPGAVAGSLLDWDNMLLACGPCNNAKGNKPSNATLHYLPESHNTHLPFQSISHPAQPDAVIIGPEASLNAAQSKKSVDTIDLLGLSAYDPRDKIVDLRWMKRKAAIQLVVMQYSLYKQAKGSPTFNVLEAAEAIAMAARECGFFSLWYTAFHNEPEVMCKLTDNTIIPGTATSCFDAANGYKPVGRNQANAADPI